MLDLLRPPSDLILIKQHVDHTILDGVFPLAILTAQDPFGDMSFDANLMQIHEELIWLDQVLLSYGVVLGNGLAFLPLEIVHSESQRIHIQFLEQSLHQGLRVLHHRVFIIHFNFVGDQFQREIVLSASLFVAHQNVVGDKLHAERVFSKLINFKLN